MKKILIVVLLCSFPLISIAQSGLARFIYVRGKQSPYNASRGSTVAPLDTIRVLDKSLAVLRFEDKSKIKLDPNTVVEVETLIKKHFDTKSGKSQTSLRLKAGSLMAKIINKYKQKDVDDTPPMEIKNDHVSIGVRGTTFFTGIDSESNNMWTSVKDGEVQALNFSDDDSEVIGAGQSIAIEKKRNFTKPSGFEWSDKLNWNMDPSKGKMISNFGKTRADRFSEYSKRRKNLQKRLRKSFKNKMKRRYKMLRKRRQQYQNKFKGSQKLFSKKYKKLNSKKRNKFQEMSDRRKKRLKNRFKKKEQKSQ